MVRARDVNPTCVFADAFVSHFNQVSGLPAIVTPLVVYLEIVLFEAVICFPLTYRLPALALHAPLEDLIYARRQSVALSQWLLRAVAQLTRRDSELFHGDCSMLAPQASTPSIQISEEFLLLFSWWLEVSSAGWWASPPPTTLW